jgi:hypothetical protein
MPPLKARLDQLERNFGHGAKQLIVVKAGQHTDDDIDRELQRAGLANNLESQVVVLRTLYEEKDGSVARDIEPPRILSVSTLR